MRAQELHQTAAYLRERFTPPDPGMQVGMYVSHEAMHALADALDRTGDDVATEEAAQSGRTSTEGDGGAPDELHALLDFVWSRTTEEASGLVSLQGSEVQREAESYLDEHGGELLRWERQAVVVVQRIVVAALAQRGADR